MKTKVLHKTQLKEAVMILRHGGLVVFPTETVYGLGANGLDDQAVMNIFTAKGRPSDNPLILHIHDVAQLQEIVQHIPDSAIVLMKTYWPGPLTLVFDKQPHIPRNVTAGLSTVAVRMPNNEIALELLKAANIPVAAPSANISGRPSATKADHVLEDLAGKVDAIIDGGDSVIGIESTVIDMTTVPPTLLRPGFIQQSEIESLLGYSIQTSSVSEAPKSPGMKYQHYQPRVGVYWRSGNRDLILQEANTIGKTLSIIDHPTEQNFYALLRENDKEGIDAIIVITESSDFVPEGLRDRLSKASKNYLEW